jgi:hypothetical protein
MNGAFFRLLHVGFSRGLLFSPEDGGDKFLQNVGRLTTASYEMLLMSQQLQIW